jgi:acyl-CoA synthetase (NDP forming)
LTVLTNEMKTIIEASREAGWVLEPDAKKILGMAGFDVPRFRWAADPKEAAAFANEIGYPVVAKVVSPKILHKSDIGGVVTGIANDKQLGAVFKRLSREDGFAGVIVEETLFGVELIAGAKIDEQFGPVLLVGLGGVGVEIYKDTAIRMAPIEPRDVDSMVRSLKARKLIEGYRGAEPVNMALLTTMLVNFSRLVMDMESLIESIDLNPVMCSSQRCVVADARIILQT